MATIPVELGLLDWGPVSGWVGAVATFVAAFVALAVALGAFDRFRRPRLRMTFEPVEPWCRAQSREDESTVLWIRVGVENVGRRVAEGCVGRLVGVTSGDTPRRDIDPVQLRWAGVPRSRAFNPVDLRRDQREYLNVCAYADAGWRILTFEDPDFDPGFTTLLAPGARHVLVVALFSGNAATTTRSLTIEADGHTQVAGIRLDR